MSTNAPLNGTSGHEITATKGANEGVESAKRKAAQYAVDQYFDTSFKYVGIGSGTTVVYVIEAIKEKCKDLPHRPMFIPTGYQSRLEIETRGLTSIRFESLSPGTMIDVAFDGADEVDDDLNCVKGGGMCLFQEKLVAMRARKFVCVADYRKDSSRLLTSWDYIPIEVCPIAAPTVLKALRVLGCPNPTLRYNENNEKAGPVKTDQDFYIIKAEFPPLLTEKDAVSTSITGSNTKGKTRHGDEGRVWEVSRLASAIKSIPGVLEVGIFHGVDGVEASKLGLQGGQKPVEVFFGMADGSVQSRKAHGTTSVPSV